MNSAPWIQIDSTNWPNVRTGKIHGLKAESFIAPHQLPKAVRGFFDAAMRTFVVEFRYPDDEEFRRELEPRLNNSVWYRLGKNSRRLFGLEIGSSAPEKSTDTPPSVEPERFEEAVRKLMELLPDGRELENYSLAMRAIESRKGLLTCELQAKPASDSSPYAHAGSA